MTKLANRFRIVVIGNSHQFVLRLAYETRDRCGRAEGLELWFIPFHTETYKPILVEGEFQPAIREELQTDALGLVVSTLGGNHHNLLGLVNHPVKFDFILPEAPDLPLQEDVNILPVELVKRALRERAEESLAFMPLLQRSTSAPLYHFESPPPVPSEDHIRENPDAFAELISQHGVAPASLRYKLWRLHSSIFREACDRSGFKFLPAPKAMQDERGMLVPQAWHEDPTHANQVYGERMYRQLLAIVERRFASGSQTQSGA
ncbi:MAG TPA: hypothetical protein VGN57_06720 [Pirellulaceae bacterium]|jgi:hypothetical protein|nr:hypothetical protein [Pirellulaceae bacterium]